MEIKTLLQIKDGVAQRNSYKSFEDFENDLAWNDDADVGLALDMIDEVAKEYASQFIDLGIEKVQTDNYGIIQSLSEIKDLINKEG